MHQFVNTEGSGVYENYTLDPKEIQINEYFQANPDQIMGEIILDQTTQGKRIACVFSGSDQEFLTELEKIIMNVTETKEIKTKLQVSKIEFYGKTGSDLFSKDFNDDDKCIIEYDDPEKIWGVANAYLNRWRQTSSNLGYDKLNVTLFYGEEEFGWNIEIQSEVNSGGEPEDLAAKINFQIDYGCGLIRHDHFTDTDWQGHLDYIEKIGVKERFLKLRSQYEVPDKYFLETEDLPFNPNAFYLLERISFFVNEPKELPYESKTWDWDQEILQSCNWRRKTEEYHQTYTINKNKSWNSAKLAYKKILDRSPTVGCGKFTPLEVRLNYEDGNRTHFLLPLQSIAEPWHGVGTHDLFKIINLLIDFETGKYKPICFDDQPRAWEQHLKEVREGSLLNYNSYLQEHYQLDEFPSQPQIQRSQMDKKSTQTQPTQTQPTQKDETVLIPGSKFKNNSANAFIVCIGGRIEFYFHPEFKESTSSIIIFLLSSGFKQDQDIPQLYSASAEGKDTAKLKRIVANCDKYGAYLIPEGTNLKDLPDYSERKIKEVPPKQEKPTKKPTAAKFSTQVKDLIDQHMITIEQKIEEKIAAVSRQADLEKYEAKIKDLENQLIATKGELAKVNFKLEDTTKELAEAKSELGNTQEELNSVNVMIGDADTDTTAEPREVFVITPVDDIDDSEDSLNFLNAVFEAENNDLEINEQKYILPADQNKLSYDEHNNTVEMIETLNESFANSGFNNKPKLHLDTSLKETQSSDALELAANALDSDLDSDLASDIDDLDLEDLGLDLDDSEIDSLSSTTAASNGKGSAKK